MNYDIADLDGFDELKPTAPSTARVTFVCPCGKQTSRLYYSMKKDRKLQCTTCLKQSVKRDTTPMLRAISERRDEVNEKRAASISKAHAEGRLKSFGLGDENVSCRADVKAKKRETIIRTFGSWSEYARARQLKTRATNLNRYGVEVASKLPEVSRRALQTKKERYGTLGSPHSGKRQYCFDHQLFNNSLELAYYAHQKSLGNKLMRNTTPLPYIADGAEHSFYPDFVDELGQHIEVRSIFNSRAHTREKQLLPDVFWPSSDELNDAKSYMRETFGSSWTKQFLRPSAQEIFEMCRQTPDPRASIPLPKTLSDASIRYFHKSIYAANVRGCLSPLDAYNDDALLKKCIKNRLRYYTDEITPFQVLRGFGVSKIAPKASVFSSALAARLISTYLSDVSEIRDPFSGFSGRLIGAVECGKRYIGSDVSETHVRESNELIKHHHIEGATVSREDVLRARPASYESLLTCPPYGDAESWDGAPASSLSCDDWIDVCLSAFKCDRYIFVVDKTERFSQYARESLPSSSHLYGRRSEQVLVITRERRR